MKPRKAAVVFIFITVTLDMLALGLIMPVLPKLVLNFLGGDAPNAAKVFGIFGTIFALMQFFFSPMLGVLSDQVGRRPVVLLSNLGLGLDYIVMALAPTIGWRDGTKRSMTSRRLGARTRALSGRFSSCLTCITGQ